MPNPIDNNANLAFTRFPSSSSSTSAPPPPPPPPLSYPDTDTTTSTLNLHFTPDQSHSLHHLLHAHQSYLFRCLYEMETHLEISLEELKKRQTRTEIQIAKLNFLVESTRCNMVSLAKGLDVLDVQHQCRGGRCQRRGEKKKKRKKGGEGIAVTVSPSLDAPMETTVTNQVNGLSASPGYSDTSTLLNGCPSASASLPATRVISMDTNTNINPSLDESPSPPSQRTNQFASAPTVSSGFSPVTWAAKKEDVPIVVERGNDPTTTMLGLESTPLELVSESELELDVVELATRGDMDFSDPGSEQETDDEESVLMQLVSHAATTPTPTPIPSSPPSRPPSVMMDDLEPLPPSLRQSPTLPPPPLSTRSRSPPPRSMNSLPSPNPPKPEAQESAPPLTIDPRELQPYLFQRSLSPLSVLTESTSCQSPSFQSVGMHEGDTGLSFDGDDSDASLDDIALSAVLTKSVRMRVEQKRALKSKKRKAMKRKGPSKRLEHKIGLAREKKRKAAQNEKDQEKRKKRLKKVAWPEKYKGDEEDEFYRTLVECDVCSCWYHYGCVGIKPQDKRLRSPEIYVCPVCVTKGENTIRGKGTCSRPDCGRSEVQPGEYFVSGIVGRKLRYDEKGSVRFLYLVKWDGYSVADGTWESKNTLKNPQKLIREFEEACLQEGLTLDSPEPILLKEAVEVGWRHVLAYTDPPGVQMSLEDGKL